MSASTGAAANRDEGTTCGLGEGLREQSGVALALAEPVTQTDSVASSVPIPKFMLAMVLIQMRGG